MHWAEKVELLLDAVKARTGKRPSYRSVEIAAGMGTNVLISSIRRRGELGFTKAANLARALGVSADWLFDTTKGMGEIQYHCSANQESFQVLLRKTIEACPPGCKIVIDTTMKSGDVPDV